MTSIMLVDDHHIVRQGMKQLLELQEGFSICAEATDGEEAVLKALTHKPDVILMDVNLPKVSGYEASKSILGAWPDAKILVLTNEDDAQTLGKIMALPVKGYLLKDIQIDELVQHFQAVMAGQTVNLAADLNEKLDALQKQTSVKESSVFALTDREKEILRALTRGYSNHQLATHFTVSQKTIHNHLYSIYSKIGVSSRTEAIVWAIETGCD